MSKRARETLEMSLCNVARKFDSANATMISEVFMGKVPVLLKISCVKGFYVNRGKWTIIAVNVQRLDEGHVQENVAQPVHITTALKAPEGMLGKERFPKLWKSFPCDFAAYGYYAGSFTKDSGEVICLNFNAVCFFLPNVEYRREMSLLNSRDVFTMSGVGCAIVEVISCSPFGVGRKAMVRKNGEEISVTQYKVNSYDVPSLKEGQKYVLIGVKAAKNGGGWVNGNCCQFIAADKFVEMTSEEYLVELEAAQLGGEGRVDLEIVEGMF